MLPTFGMLQPVLAPPHDPSEHGKWYIFNDRKVAESLSPPSDLAYIYFYERV